MPVYSKIKKIKAFEVLDSVGDVSLRIEMELENSLKDSLTLCRDYYQAPFSEEECLVDNDNKRYGGNGLLLTISKINDFVSPKLIGKKINQQEEIDKILISLSEGTSKIISKAISNLISSLVAKLAANQNKESLFLYLNKLYKGKTKKEYNLPLPMISIFNGGDTGDTDLDFQEYLLLPKRKRISEIIRSSSEIYNELALILHELSYDTDTGKEGGYAPDISSSVEAIELIMSAIIRAGYRLEEDYSLGIDIGSSILYNENEKKYIFAVDRGVFNTGDLLSLYNDWLGDFPIKYLEDPFDVNDIDSWKNLNNNLGKKLIISGDDLFSSNIERLRQVDKQGLANATLIKPGQIGTLTEVFKYVKLAKDRGYITIMSARNKDNINTFVSDLSVSLELDYVKFGSLSRGERIEKYNRLIEIENDLLN